MAKHTLFTDIATTGDSTVFVWPGGIGTLILTGTIGTYVGTGLISVDGTNFVTMRDVNGIGVDLTVEDMFNFYAPTGSVIKVNNSTMTSTTVTGTLFVDMV